MRQPATKSCFSVWYVTIIFHKLITIAVIHKLDAGGLSSIQKCTSFPERNFVTVITSVMDIYYGYITV